jgi:hypothetical protein
LCVWASRAAQLSKNQPKKPKMYLPLNFFVKNHKNKHLSFSGWNFCGPVRAALLA